MAFISSKKSFLKSAASGDLQELEYCLTFLVPEKFSIDVKDKYGRTALCLAAANGRTDALKKLLDRKANTEIYIDNSTPLLQAVNDGQTAVARMLIAASADVNAHNEEYVTPIIPAGRQGQLDVVKDLAAAKADLNAVSRATGRTALHWAVANGHGPIVEFLLSQNVRTDILDREGCTPLDLAKKGNLERIAKLFPATVTTATATPATAAPSASTDGWELMGSARVAHVGSYAGMGRKITEIFNFESRERIIITENLKTGAETMTQPEKFEALGEDTVARAEERLKALGGAVPDKGPKRAFNL
jgi:ankyrin repeat protein